MSILSHSLSFFKYLKKITHINRRTNKRVLLLSWITLWIFFTGIFMIFFPWLNLFHSITKIPLENRKTTTNTNLESWQDGNEIKLFVDLEFWKYVKWISIVKSDFSPLLQFLNFNMMVRWNHYCGWNYYFYILQSFCKFLISFLSHCFLYFVYVCLFTHFILMSDRIKI